MKRLVVFVCYASARKFSKYVYNTLNRMLEFFDDVVVVVNGYIDEEFKTYLNAASVTFLHRKNVGYDAEAYREVLLNHIGYERLCEYDEILLQNDSFYGPFCSYEEVFDKFSLVECDFWGMTKWYGGNSEFLEYKNVPQHIQSYFIVFRKQVIESNSFWLFWKNMNKVKSFKDAVCYFEIAISDYLVKQGFKFKVWTDLYNDNSINIPNNTVFCTHPAELICIFQLPILKRKSICIGKMNDLRYAIEYIKKHYDYDVNLIMSDIFDYDMYSRSGLHLKDIKQFLESHNRIYIYGHGIIGNKLLDTCLYFNKKVEGFVISKKENQNTDIVFDDLVLENNDGLIIGMNKANTQEVIGTVLKRFNKENVLYCELDS